MKTIQCFEVKGQQKRKLHVSSKFMSAIAMVALGTTVFSAVHAQATNSSIIGKAPIDGTVTVHSDTGITRHGTPNDKGRYNLSSLPPGVYLVSLDKNGKTLASLPGVPLFAGKAFEVDFACDNDQCSVAAGH